MPQTREQKRQYLAEWRRKNPDKQRAITLRAHAKVSPEERAAQYRKRRELDPRPIRNRGLKAKYGITIEQYDMMFAQQNGVCAVCATVQPGRPLDVDHCHDTGVIRGLLCNPCNMALGLLKDDPLRIRSLEKYISNFAWLKT